VRVDTLNNGDELIRISGLVPAMMFQRQHLTFNSGADAAYCLFGPPVPSHASQPGWLSSSFLSPLWPFKESCACAACC